jgi:PAS domain S-box-containing protein
MREKVRTFLTLAARHETERSLAEQQVNEAEQRLQLALTAAKMVAWVWDRDTDVVVCSEGAIDLFGHRLETVGVFMNHVAKEDQHGLTAAVNAVWNGHGDLDHEFRVIQADGSFRWIEAKGRLISSDGAHRMFGVSLDVTPRRLANDHLQQLNEALKAARDQAIYATRAKSLFLNAFGHELKTPLNGIINYAEMIQEEVESKSWDQIHSDAGVIRQLGAQLDKVVDEIIDLAHSSSPDIEPK